MANHKIFRSTTYRVVFFLIDPFVGGRVAIGSLCEHRDGVTFVRCELPDGVTLSGVAAALVETACARLVARSTNANAVESLGPCFSLSETRWTPRVEDPLAWLSLLVTSYRSAAQQDGAK